MPNLINEKNKPTSKLPTSIQSEFSALWSGDTLEFEMEEGDGFVVFILDDDEE